jgi:hypothetical protein
VVESYGHAMLGHVNGNTLYIPVNLAILEIYLKNGHNEKHTSVFIEKGRNSLFMII